MKRIFTRPDPVRNFSGLHRFPRSHTYQQRGAIMMLTSVMMVALIGMLALAVDLGYLFSSQAQLQNGVNAAALAAGAGLRVTIEADPKAPEQENIAKDLAVRYGSQNHVRRFPDPDPKSGDPNKNSIIVKAEDVTVDTTNDIPTVKVSAFVRMPMLFASVFGVFDLDLGATATASLLPVDGGTGMMAAAGDNRGGCWRPLFLPDTFYNLSNTVEMVGVNSNTGATRLPNQPGDYYRSRFAAGARNVSPFVEAFAGVGPNVTGLRDTRLKAEIGQYSIMGEHPVAFRPEYYFIAKLSELKRVSSIVRTEGEVAAFGYCGKIRVGDDIPVHPFNDQAKREEVRQGLLEMQVHTINGDVIQSVPEDMFRYVTSNSYRDPNSHGAIIPVLLYSPIIWKDETAAKSRTMLRVTNIGLFLLKTVKPDGELEGYFVREIIAGGTPIDPINLDERNDDSFRRRWLPMSVQLLK